MHPYRPTFARPFLTKLTLLLFAASTFAIAQTEKSIYEFLGAPDGSQPRSGLVADKAGNFYGTTVEGGTDGFGAVFELSPPTVSGGSWTESVLYSFTGGADGLGPQGTLALDASGNLYGAAGSVFELSPPSSGGGQWTFTVLLPYSDATIPGPNEGGVIRDTAGNLYFASTFGGLDLSQCANGLFNGCGSVYELSPPSVSGGSWTLTDLYDFGTNGGTNDGLQPYWGVTLTRAGALYGTANAGTHSNGVVYKLTPPSASGGAWTETILHNFLGGTTDGSAPTGSILIGKSGVLYGVTTSGGTGEGGFYGVVYQITPPAPGSGWKESVIYNFAGTTDGANPYSGVIADSTGNLYGTTYLFGGKCRLSVAGCGTVYKLGPPSVSGQQWTETTLHSFSATGTDGANPWAPLNLINGTLYGTASLGGTVSHTTNGVVFQITAN